MQSEQITFGPIPFEIQDLQRSIGFWRDVVGLYFMNMAGRIATMGIDGIPLVVLDATATRPGQRGYSGLYHLAIQRQASLSWRVYSPGCTPCVIRLAFKTT